SPSQRTPMGALRRSSQMDARTSGEVTKLSRFPSAKCLKKATPSRPFMWSPWTWVMRTWSMAVRSRFALERSDASRRTDRYMSGQSTAREAPPQRRRSEEGRWCSEKVSPAPRTITWNASAIEEPPRHLLGGSRRRPLGDDRARGGREREIALDGGDQGTRRRVRLGRSATEGAALDAPADDRRQPLGQPLQLAGVLRPDLRLAERFPAEEDPTGQRLRVRVRAQPEVDVDERGHLRPGVTLHRRQPGLQPRLVADHQQAQGFEEDLLLALEVVMDQAE